MTRPKPDDDRTFMERFAHMVDIDPLTGCHNWKGFIASGGYGKCDADIRGTQYAHRTAYILLHGPVAPGLELDHLCRNRRCVNPDHLEPVTRRENQRRGVGPIARNIAKTHCVNGHPFDEANTVPRSDGNGRVCLICRRDRARRGAARKREADRAKRQAEQSNWPQRSRAIGWRGAR